MLKPLSLVCSRALRICSLRSFVSSTVNSSRSSSTQSTALVANATQCCFKPLTNPLRSLAVAKPNMQHRACSNKPKIRPKHSALYLQQMSSMPWQSEHPKIKNAVRMYVCPQVALESSYKSELNTERLSLRASLPRHPWLWPGAGRLRRRSSR